ncbi:MAG: hypothetical protein HFG57_10830 [Lachnospiraceae bacterium]|jgi:hypothetical protein|nr:hypothetical protein [Lachnospiraceae bacterium]
MGSNKIAIDPILLTYVAQTLGRVPETFYDFQKIKNLTCGGRPVYQKWIDPLHDPLPERLEIVKGDFSVIGKMSRLKKLAISAMQVNDFSFLKTCTALESLEISACGAINCAFLKDLKNLKSLSLLECSELIHMEDILKLFRLNRLSLEGSTISNADCFMDCKIKEVYLPEHCLKTKQPENKAISKTKKAGVQLCAGVPFQAAKRKVEQYSYTLQKFDSILWEVYRGAYGDVREYLVILMGEREDAPETFKLRRLDNALKTNYELAFDNLCENLWHQMSFYHATWLAVPYLARLMKDWEKENDIKWLFQGILAAGNCLATDVYGDRPGENYVQESYENAILQIRDITIDFLAGHMDYVREKHISWRRGFAFAVTAILGENRLAFMLTMSELESCYIVCPGCENCDEEIEFGYFDPSKRIEKAEIPAKKWDGESLSDIKSWLYNLFALLDDTEGMERLLYYFGTYVCPECGERTSVFTGMAEYFLP